MPRAMPAPPSAPSTAPVSMPAPKVSPPAARSAASPRQRAGHDAAHHRGLAFAHRRVDRDAAGEAREHVAFGAAVEPVERDQLVGARAQRVVETRRHRLRARALRPFRFAADAETASEVAQRAAIALPASASRSHAAAAIGAASAAIASSNCAGDAPATRRRGAARTRAALRQRLADEIEQRDLLHPAARERVERRHRADDGRATERGAPASLPRPASSSRGRGRPVWLISTITGLPIHSRTSSSGAR